MKTPSNPPIQGYIATAEQLGFTFSYPPDFLGSIEPIRQVVEEQDGGLGVWFLQPEEVARLSKSAANLFHREHLVPFARFDNGDWLCYFDADRPNKILVTNLGESPPRLYEQAEPNYSEFIASVMRNLELPVPKLVQHGSSLRCSRDA